MGQKRYKLIWKLHTVMSDRGIRTSTELHRRLEPYGIDITSHQLSRIVSNLPARLNTDVLNVLMTELDCTAADLLQQVEVAPAVLAESAPAESAPVSVAPPVDKTTPPKTVQKTARKVSPARQENSPPPVPIPAAVLGPNVVTLPQRKPTK